MPTGSHQRDEVGEGEGQVDIHDLVSGDDGAHLLVVALLLEEVVDEPLLLVHAEPAWECGVRQTRGAGAVAGPSATPQGCLVRAVWCKDGGDRSRPGHCMSVLHRGKGRGHAGMTDMWGHMGTRGHGHRATHRYRPSIHRVTQTRDTWVQTRWHCAHRWMHTRRHTWTWTQYKQGHVVIDAVSLYTQAGTHRHSDTVHRQTHTYTRPGQGHGPG